LFDKESKFYSELESLALKIASENQIENVSQVKIAIDEDDAVMQFESANSFQRNLGEERFKQFDELKDVTLTNVESKGEGYDTTHTFTFIVNGEEYIVKSGGTTGVEEVSIKGSPYQSASSLDSAILDKLELAIMVYSGGQIYDPEERGKKEYRLDWMDDSHVKSPVSPKEYFG